MSRGVTITYNTFGLMLTGVNWSTTSFTARRCPTVVGMACCTCTVTALGGGGGPPAGDGEGVAPPIRLLTSLLMSSLSSVCEVERPLLGDTI